VRADAGRTTARVTALLVAHDGAAWLPRCLAAVLDQGADEVVAVDTGSRDDSASLLRAALGDDRVVVTDRRTGFGDAVRLGIAHAEVTAADSAGRPDLDSQHWFWLLHDDCAPQPGALEALLDTAARSRQVGIVGPKLVDWDDPTRLLEVGLTVSRGGRRFTGVDGPERDQGQHDDVTDVLALGTAGLLVRADVWHELGGLDPALPLLRDDVDLGWRAQLAGHRVVLASRALVADAQASTRGLRAVDAVRGPVRRVDRVHALRVALARCSPWAVLPLLCWTLVAGVGRSIGLLAAKAPRRSLDELVATVLVLVTPWRWVSSRWRGRTAVRVRHRDINQLLAPRLAVVRRAVDAIGVLAARDADDPAALAAGGAPAEPGPVSDEADIVVAAPRIWLRRLATHPLTLVVLTLTAATAVAWRGLLGQVLANPALTGGQLGRATGRPADLWQAAVGGWTGSGLAADVVTSPAGFVRAGVATALHPLAGEQAGAVAVLLLLLLAPLLSAVCAYLALTGFVRSPWVRAWAGLAWATLPVVGTAVAGGRLGVLATLTLLPLVAAAFARALAPGARGSTTAAFAGALGIALLAAAAPVMLVPAAAAAAVGVVAGRGSARLRSAALLLVPLGLLGPWLGALVEDPRRLLAGPGLLAPAARSGLDAALSWSVLQPWAQLVRTPAGVPSWVALVAAAPVLLAGLAGLLRAGPRGRASLALWLVGAAAVAAAVLAPFVVLVRTDVGGAGPWAGTALLLTALAAVASAAVGVDGLRARLAVHRFGWRQLLVAPVVALAVLGPVVGAGLWAWRGVDGPLASGATSAAVPAVLTAAVQGPAGVRTLELRADRAALTYRLDGVEPGPWSRDLALGRAPAAGRSGDPVQAVVRDLVDGPAGFAAGDAAVDRLGRLAVGFVLVRGPVPAAVVTRLDATAGLARIGAPTGSALWRVGTGGLGTGASGALQATAQERPARVRVETSDGVVLQTLPVAGAHAATSVTLVHAAAAGDTASTQPLLVLAEPASPRWRATLDGRSLPAVRPEAGPWRQAFRLPDQRDRPARLVVSYDRSDQRWWQTGQAVLAALVLLLALPVHRPGDAGGPASPASTEESA
jgi:GT2 family glycosyltransferase